MCPGILDRILGFLLFSTGTVGEGVLWTGTLGCKQRRLRRHFELICFLRRCLPNHGSQAGLSAACARFRIVLPAELSNPGADRPRRETSGFEDSTSNSIATSPASSPVVIKPTRGTRAAREAMPRPSKWVGLVMCRASAPRLVLDVTLRSARVRGIRAKVDPHGGPWLARHCAVAISFADCASSRGWRLRHLVATMLSYIAPECRVGHGLRLPHETRCPGLRRVLRDTPPPAGCRGQSP